MGRWRFVSLEIAGLPASAAKGLPQAGERGDSARAEYDILAIGRDAVQKVGGDHVGVEAREDFNGASNEPAVVIEES